MSTNHSGLSTEPTAIVTTVFEIQENGEIHLVDLRMRGSPCLI